MKTYTINEAITFVTSRLGYTDILISSLYENKKERLVTVHQAFWPSGNIVAEFRLARGKYKGCWVATAKLPGSI